jgi:hypothetical protein
MIVRIAIDTGLQPREDLVNEGLPAP